MAYIKTALLTAFFAVAIHASAQDKAVNPAIKGRETTYTADGVTCKGYIVYDANIKGKRPAILVIPEWWGCNDYTRHRADMLAGLGYVAMAVDMYGDGKIAANPEEAGKLATPFYANPLLAKGRIEGAEKELKRSAEADTSKVAAIGYCFGGAVLLNAAKQGADFKAVVSFHGGLDGVMASRGSVKSKILVCHGAADKFVSDAEVQKFRHNLDSVGVKYNFIEYAGATHAFTNPAATETGKKFNLPIAYNETADKQSWSDMTQFLKNTFYRK